MRKMCFPKIVFILLSAAACISLSNQKRLKVTLFYETLCPDCKELILQQIFSTYEKLESDLLMDLVPYGFATSRYVDGKWEFDCQHGPIECYRNKLDACAMDQTPDQTKIMKFVYCLESQSENASDDEIKKCADLVDLNWTFLKTCADNAKGSELLLRYGKRTKEAKPQIKFVPTLFFNDYFNNTLQKRAESNFLKTVCSLLDHTPSVCKEDIDENSFQTFIL